MNAAAQWLTIAACLAFGGTAMAAGARIVVRPGTELGPVNRMVFGQNMIGYQDMAHIDQARRVSPQFSDLGSGIWDAETRRPEPQMVGLCREAGARTLRWPGGCGAHRFNWKKTVGPVEDRPNQQFGLPEFLRFCQAAGAAPMITLSVFWGDENDAADLVAYLNAPAGGGNRWADLRALDGREEPWNAVWFEYGNESYHGDHQGQSISPQEYALRFRRYRDAMRAVDPAVKLGAIISRIHSEWTREVLRSCGRHADFLVFHPYKPNYYSNEGEASAEQIARACFAAPHVWPGQYERIQGLCRELAGREDLGLCLTEYNGHFVQEQPVPYRQCLANAINNAEHLRVMMEPRSKVISSHFWQFANEYWGCVLGYPQQGEPVRKQANFFVFEMYRGHFGDRLIEADITCDTFDYEGGLGVPACTGEPAEEMELGPIDVPAEPWRLSDPPPGASHYTDDDELVADFDGSEDVNYFHAAIEMDAEPNMAYRVTVRARTEGLSGGAVGIQVGDARGWTVTRSAALELPLDGDTDWQDVTVTYRTLPDTRSIHIMARRLSGRGEVKGRARFGRIVSIEKYRPFSYGAVPVLGVNASKSEDGRTVYLMIANKTLTEATPVAVELPGTYASARAFCLSGPSPDATNLKEPATIAIRPLPVATTGEGTFALELPPCSLTALELSK